MHKVPINPAETLQNASMYHTCVQYVRVLGSKDKQGDLHMLLRAKLANGCLVEDCNEWRCFHGSAPERLKGICEANFKSVMAGTGRADEKNHDWLTFMRYSICCSRWALFFPNDLNIQTQVLCASFDLLCKPGQRFFFAASVFPSKEVARIHADRTCKQRAGATWKDPGASKGTPLYGFGFYFAERITKAWRCEIGLSWGVSLEVSCPARSSFWEEKLLNHSLVGRLGRSWFPARQTSMRGLCRWLAIRIGWCSPFYKGLKEVGR